jgi:hypothetical protein
MVRSRNPLRPPPLPASPLSSSALSAFSSLPSFCSGGSSDPCSCPLPSSFDASIPFRITSFAHPHHLTPIESYSCKKQGRGDIQRHPAQALPIFPTASKHPARRNGHKPSHFMCLLHILWIPLGWGWEHDSWQRPSRFLELCLTGYEPRNTGHLFSARLCELCVSALSFSALCLSTFDCRLLALSQSKGQLSPSPRTSTLPPRIYGIIPPHRGTPASRLTKGRIPVRKRGGFSD